MKKRPTIEYLSKNQKGFSVEDISFIKENHFNGYFMGEYNNKPKKFNVWFFKGNNDKTYYGFSITKDAQDTVVNSPNFNTIHEARESFKKEIIKLKFKNKEIPLTPVQLKLDINKAPGQMSLKDVIQSDDKPCRNAEVSRNINNLINQLLQEASFRPAYNIDTKRIIPNSEYKERLEERRQYDKKKYNEGLYKNLYLGEASNNNALFILGHGTDADNVTTEIAVYELMEMARLDSFIGALTLLASSRISNEKKLLELFNFYHDRLEYTSTVITPGNIKRMFEDLLQRKKLNTCETEMFLSDVSQLIEI